MSLRVTQEPDAIVIAECGRPAHGVRVPDTHRARLAAAIAATPLRPGDHLDVGNADHGASIERTGLGLIAVWPLGDWLVAANQVVASAEDWAAAFARADYQLPDPVEGRSLAQSLGRARRGMVDS